MSTRFPNLTVIEHPLIQHKLAVLRDRETSKKKFKELVDEISMLMAYEVTKDLPLEPVEIETPLERATVQRLAGKKLTVVPILRAGLGMVDGVVRLMPGRPPASALLPAEVSRARMKGLRTSGRKSAPTSP